MTDEEAAQSDERNLDKLRSAYKQVFATQDPNLKVAVATVLDDLYSHCYMGTGGFFSDTNWLQHISGRREIYSRITVLAGLTSSDIEKMALAQSIAREEMADGREPVYDPLHRGAR